MDTGSSVHILVINSGSSSIKFSIFADGPSSARGPAKPSALFTGEISGVGGPQLKFQFRDADGKDVPSGAGKGDQSDPLDLLESAVLRPGIPPIDTVGYRVVHPGAKLRAHQRITPQVLDDLKEAIAFAPLHDPEAIRLIEEMLRRFPKARHYACFDTIFHETMPAAASTYPIPLEYRQRGVHRYGFHGLSCEAVVEDLKTASGKGEVPHRTVIAHLGSGCSVTALVNGASIDTTMGLTPTGGVVMGTRPGDLDPGLVLYLLRQADGDREAALKAVEALLNHRAGMVALSGLPNDMQAIRKAKSAEAALALEIFTRTVRKAIGSFAWLMGGLDAVVFTGGIGEHDVQTRTDVLLALESYGVTMDAKANATTGDKPRLVSQPGSAVAVWVVPAQEDRMIAVHVAQMDRNA